MTIHDLGTLPQGDGDSTPLRLPSERPFASVIGEGVNGPVRVHLEKSGPAWPRDDSRVGEPMVPVRNMLVESLQAQALTAVGHVLNSLQRRCLIDLCAQWPRLLKLAGVKSSGYRRQPREQWAWAEMTEAVIIALCYSEHPDSLKWQDADSTLRGYAMQAAHASQSHLDGGELSLDDVVRVQRNHQTYLDFAEGRI